MPTGSPYELGFPRAPALVGTGSGQFDFMFEYYQGTGRTTQTTGGDMFAAAAANTSHPAVAALLGLGAAGLAGAVVAMAWNVHARQIRLAERLARRQFIVAGETGPAGGAAGQGGGQQADEAAERVNGTGQAAPVVIDGPDAVITGEQARYRVRPSGSRKVVAWAVGGGSVSQAPDLAHPDELLLIADRPGDLTIIVRVRDGMTERRGTKSITAMADLTPAPPFTLRLFLHGWGLVAVAVLIAGFAAALDALGNLASADFIALVAPLVAVLGVVAVARGMGESPGGHGPGAAAPPVRALRPDELLPGGPPAGELPVRGQPAHNHPAHNHAAGPSATK
jgi:hypothetical protein